MSKFELKIESIAKRLNHIISQNGIAITFRADAISLLSMSAGYAVLNEVIKNKCDIHEQRAGFDELARHLVELEQLTLALEASLSNQMEGTK